MKLSRAAVIVLLLSTAAPVSAQVTLPNGLVVPRDSANGETQLYTLFSSRSEPIDWVAEARATPDVFSPLCGFTATLVLKQSASVLGVGWYNVVPGASTPPTEIYEIVPPGAAVGTMVTGADIRADSRYLGGLIGFALIRTPPHYTEARWNTVCDSGPCASTPGPWTLSLSYLSETTPDAWYVAFEDGDTSSSSWNNDGDYNDYVFFFTGITCAGAGQPCDVADALGVCRNGLTECSTGGELTCRQVETAGEERCDGADNDCDGTIDDGDLCGAMRVCVAGVCVGRCFEGGCGEGERCSDEGVCLEIACEGVSCGEGERCVGGTCMEACAGVVCPGELVCRVGRCVDPCTSVTCDGGRVCEGGVCVDGCDCRGCPEGRECASSGECVPSGCAGVTCGAGEVCRGGSCVDACLDAVCPVGQVCEGGACVDDAGSDAGTPSRDGGSSGTDSGAVGMDGGTRDAGSGGRGMVASGCGCRASHGGAGGGLLCLALAALWIRRRRR